MNRFGFSIAKYILQSIIPYFAFSWLLLSVILFVQQASRHSDIFFSNNLPSSLFWQLTFALIPNVVAFTCPMAILVGVIIGISKMQGDSELIAIRAAGVSNIQITIPIIFLGILLSVFAFTINLKGVPVAAQIVRRVGTQMALYKLESPVEPGVFNSEIEGFTIYVKGGDLEKGLWKNIFIYSEDDKTRQSRLITSRNGRIDSKNDDSELVLEKALVTTFSTEKPYKNLFTEKVDYLRFVIQTKRQELIEKLSRTEETAEEMGLSQLAEYADTLSGKQKIEAQILWHRRIILSLTPLIFAVLGASLILRFDRKGGGKGFGAVLALGSLIFYYLITLLGEQLARNEIVSVLSGSLFPIIVTCFLIAWFFLSHKLFRNRSSVNFLKNFEFDLKERIGSKLPRYSVSNLTTGILDFDIVTSVLRYFLMTFVFISSIYLIFTAFELWKFAGAIDNGIYLLAKYLGFLFPYIYIQISPTALMIAMLATYVIKSRQNEVVTWTASGQSIYRLLFPCFVLMIVIGFFNWQIQERVLPKTNLIQDEIRTQIRNNGVVFIKEGKYWVANDNRIYSFELTADSKLDVDRRKVQNLTVYQFTDTGSTALQSFIKSDEAIWENGKIKFVGNVDKTIWVNDIPQTDNSSLSGGELAENFNPFKQTLIKASHLNTPETVEMLRSTEAETERRLFGVALQKKYATPFLPFIITFFTAPFALSLSRKGKVVTIGYAVGIWLLFMGLTSVFEQMGLSGFVPPAIAVWSPLFLFLLIGAYLLSKVRT